MTITQSIDDDVEYTIEWSEHGLQTGDTIASSSWDIPAGLTSSADDFTTTTTSAFIAGGVAGTTYSVNNTIVTTNGETIKRTLRIKTISEIEVS